VSSPGSSSAAIPAPLPRCARGLEETLTLQRLGIDGQLWRTLSSTNLIETMTEIVRRTNLNLTYWANSEMWLRWTAAGMLEAEHQFRKIIGYQHLARLAVAVEADVAAQLAAIALLTSTEPVATLATVG